MSDRLEVLRELMESDLNPVGTRDRVRQLIEESHPSDLAFALSELEPEDASKHFALLDN